MSLLSRIFKPPVKPWEREYVQPTVPQKLPRKMLEKSAGNEPEIEGFEDEPGFLSRVLGPSLKQWEQEYAASGASSKAKNDSPGEVRSSDQEPSGKLQRALCAIAEENRDTPDLFANITGTIRKGSARRYQPAASMPEIEGAVNLAINAIGNSPEQFDKVAKAALTRLKGKTVDAKILNEKVRAKLG